jgi:acyl-CoA synthetase (AMP-forming)/AMP-acid ligase II
VGVGNRTLDGSIGGPHVWIELAGEPVWFSNHPSCRKEPLPTVLGARDKRHIANYWKFVEKYQVTRLSAVPTTLAVLAKSPPVDTDLSSLRPNFITGSTSLPVSVQRRFEDISGEPNAVRLAGVAYTGARRLLVAVNITDCHQLPPDFVPVQQHREYAQV